MPFVLGLAFFSSGLADGPPAAATELANVFSQRTAPEAKQAAEASAQALGALETLFNALKLRERGAPGSVEALDQAANLLMTAQKQMQSVNLSNLKSARFNQESMSQQQAALLDYALRSVGFKYSGETSIAELYAAFIEMTGRLASILKEVEKAESRPILPQIADALTLYIQYGALLSRLAQNTQ
ncbi:MAG TPA: hypothetical protein VM659_04585 [Dongiaceae bacterium]|nr:hypothetical protein [Dongiaceae bacterium]